MARFTFICIAAAASLILAAPAEAAAPERATSHIAFSGLDDEATAACGFDVYFALDRTRVVTTYENGDVRRHTQLILSWSANGKSVVEKATFNVMIASGSATWTIVGAFAHQRMNGEGTISLVSGRLFFDAETGELADPNPGPHALDDAEALAQICQLLAA